MIFCTAANGHVLFYSSDMNEAQLRQASHFLVLCIQLAPEK